MMWPTSNSAYAPPYGSAKDAVNLAGMAAQNIRARARCPRALGRDRRRSSPTRRSILDVRDAAERDAGAIPNSVHIPLKELRCAARRIAARQGDHRPLRQRSAILQRLPNPNPERIPLPQSERFLQDVENGPGRRGREVKANLTFPFGCPGCGPPSGPSAQPTGSSLGRGTTAPMIPPCVSHNSR